MGLISSVGEKQSVIKLPRFRPLERVHLLIQAIACGRRYSIIHATVCKHIHYPFLPLLFSFFCIATLLLAFQSDVSGWCRFANLAGFLEELIGQDSRTLVDSAYETLVGFISIKDQSHVINSWQGY